LTHYGLFAELVSLSSLHRIEATVSEHHYREHLTSHIVQHPTRYQCQFLPIPEFIEAVGALRLTVDTARDFEICKDVFAEVISRYGASFSAKQLVETIEALPQEIRTEMAQQIEANQK
jgi:spore coat polysaccharide biosynthesis protein SpsF (cytidylyltransferase family)